MIKVPYDSTRKYDKGLSFVIDKVKKGITEKEDDFLLLMCGFRGSGKSNLTLWTMDEYLLSESSVDYLGLDHKSFARALYLAKNKALPRICVNDEANISKRDTQRTYNKDLLDLYYSIRGKQIFHIWNNPSLDIIDKKFIEDLVKGVIFVANKVVNRPRMYYYFKKRDLIKVMEKYDNLSLRLLKKIAKQHAYYQGWFREYDGPLLESYMKKKECRMDDKVDNFYEKYGEVENNTESFLLPGKMVKEIGISRMTFSKYVKELKSKDMLPDDLVKQNVVGHNFYHPSLIDVMKQMVVQKKMNNISTRRNVKK